METNPKGATGTLTTLTMRLPGISAAELLKVKAKSPPSTEVYRRAVRAFLAWADKRTLTVELFASFIEHSRHAGASASKLNRDLYGGKAAILQTAQRQGMSTRELAMLKGVLDSIPRAKTNAPEIRVVSPEERVRLISALPLRVRLIARFLYATAARVTEALEVRLSDTKQDGDRVLLRFHGKGNKERWGRIPMSLLEEIEEEYGKKGREYLFESLPGGQFSRQYVTREIGRAARRVLNRRISAHNLRHSRATDLFEKTRRLKGISEMLGHSSTATTARFYVRDSLTDDELFEGERL
jgi:integrase